MHSGGFELTKLIYTRLEDNLIRHRGGRLSMPDVSWSHHRIRKTDTKRKELYIFIWQTTVEWREKAARLAGGLFSIVWIF